MPALTRRERLERCYRHQPVDRPAIYCMRLFPTDDPSYDSTRAYVDRHTALKGRWATSICETPYPTETRREPHSEDWEREITFIHTPAGPLEKSSLVSLKGQPGLHQTYYVKSREDAEKYLSLPMPELTGDVSLHFERQAQVGDAGIAEAALATNPGGFAVQLLGSERFALMSVTDRDVIHALCERHMQILLNRAKYLLDRGVGPFFSLAGQEYIVPPLHGPADFRDFNVRYDKPVLDLIHDAGGCVHIHCHGSVKKVIDDFVAMGTDVLHPFEPPPQGDILASEAKAAARDRMTLEGNIQIDRFYRCTPDQIRAETHALLRDAFDDGKGLIVCATASPYIRDKGEHFLQRFRAMCEAVFAASK